jgi:hypothetical protein
MIKEVIKNYKLLLISISSGYIYGYLEFSEKTNSALNLIANSTSNKGFAIYVFINIGKFVSIVFCVISLTIFLRIIFTKNN